MAILVKQITATHLLRGIYSDGTTHVNTSERWTHGWVQGGGPGEAQQYFERSDTATAVGVAIELSGGPDTDIFGNPLEMTNVHAFCFRNTSIASGAGIVLSGDFIAAGLLNATNVTINPDGGIEWCSEIGKDITGSSNSIGYIRSGSVDAAHEMFIVGTILEEV